MVFSHSENLGANFRTVEACLHWNRRARGHGCLGVICPSGRLRVKNYFGNFKISVCFSLRFKKILFHENLEKKNLMGLKRIVFVRQLNIIWLTFKKKTAKIGNKGEINRIKLGYGGKLKLYIVASAIRWQKMLRILLLPLRRTRWVMWVLIYIMKFVKNQ